MSEILFGKAARPYPKRKGLRDLTRVEILPEERARGGVPVTILTAEGKDAGGQRVGYVTPDGARCYVKVFGERVSATLEHGRWVYRIPASDEAA